MDKRLDKYLQILSHELKALPEEKREEELREIRQHLEAIVARLVEGGLSEEEAMEAAASHFGAARQVGHELAHALPAPESRAKLLAASLCAVACYLSLNLLLLICHRFFRFPFPFPDPDSVQGQIRLLLIQILYSGPFVVFFVAPVLGSIAFRYIAPRTFRAHRGVVLGIFGGTSALLLAATNSF